MKKLQCTNCGQVFWTEPQVDEALIGSGEWIQHPCPKCGAEWAVVEPGIRRARVIRRGRGKPGLKRRVRPRKAILPAEEKALVFSPARIRSLRRKFGISQKDLAALIKVSTGAVVNWEKGKFNPKKEKMTQLTDLAKLGKEDVKNLLTQKKLKQQVEKKPEEAQVEKTKTRRKQRTRRKTVLSPK